MSNYAYCHFCDDIRHEINGKYSLIGIYGGELNVDVLPGTLAKLCILGFCEFDIQYPPKALKMKIFAGDVVLNESEIPAQVLMESAQELSKRSMPEDPISRIMFGVHAILSPFVVESAMTLKVVFVADSEELIAGKLRIKSPATASTL